MRNIKYNIIDNYLPKEQFVLLQSVMTGDNFPWYLNSYVGNTEDTTPGHYQFTHTFFRDYNWQSPLTGILQPVLEKINPKAWIRIKANCGPRASKIEEQAWHVDFKFPCTTAILYLNDNNGYTIFEDGTKVESKANRFVEFDSSLKHSGASHTDTNTRILINFNYFK
jgi:hypothetical protein